MTSRGRLEKRKKGWRSSWEAWLLEPAICQVFPGRVVLFEQAHLPCTTPTFDLLFPGKRVTNVRELCSRWTSRVTWYVVVKPGVRPRLCSSTRRTMSFVTPTYSTREQWA